MPSRAFTESVSSNITEHMQNWHFAQSYFSRHFLNKKVSFVVLSDDFTLQTKTVVFSKAQLQHLLGLHYQHGGRKFWDDLASGELDENKLEFSNIVRRVKTARNPTNERKKTERIISKSDFRTINFYQNKMLAIKKLPLFFKALDIYSGHQPKANFVHQTDELICNTEIGVSLSIRPKAIGAEDFVFVSNLLLTLDMKYEIHPHLQRIVAIDFH